MREVLANSEIDTVRDSSLRFIAAYQLLHGTTNYVLDREADPGAYESLEVFAQEVVAYIGDISPEYLCSNNAIQSRVAAITGNSKEDDQKLHRAGNVSVVLVANRVDDFDSKNRPLLRYIGSFARDITSGIERNVISISPDDLHKRTEWLSKVVKKKLKDDVGYYNVAIHEIAHMFHEFDAVEQYLRQHHEWSLSDSMPKAILIEKERFATSIEIALTARYISHNYGGDLGKIVDQLRHAYNARKVEESFKEWEGKDAKNIGYTYPLTNDQLGARLDAMVDIANDPNLVTHIRQFKMNRSDESEYTQALQVAQVQREKQKRLEKRVVRRKKSIKAMSVLVGLNTIACGAYWLGVASRDEVILDSDKNEAGTFSAENYVNDEKELVLNGVKYILRKNINTLESEIVRVTSCED